MNVFRFGFKDLSGCLVDYCGQALRGSHELRRAIENPQSTIRNPNRSEAEFTEGKSEIRNSLRGVGYAGFIMLRSVARARSLSEEVGEPEKCV